MEEVWKDIEGYEGLYQVSNLGNVKSLSRLSINGVKIDEKILKGGISTHGYRQVMFWKDGRCKTFQIHRLVALHFIPNPNNYPCVNHMDEVKTNNNVSNLEWCTYKYNLNYGTTQQRRVESSMKNRINQYDKQGNFITQWKCIKIASKETGVHRSGISMTCRGERRTAGGYVWKYADSEREVIA